MAPNVLYSEAVHGLVFLYGTSGIGHMTCGYMMTIDLSSHLGGYKLHTDQLDLESPLVGG